MNDDDDDDDDDNNEFSSITFERMHQLEQIFVYTITDMDSKNDITYLLISVVLLYLFLKTNSTNCQFIG